MPHEYLLAGFHGDLTLAEDNTRLQGHGCLIREPVKSRGHWIEDQRSHSSDIFIMLKVEVFHKVVSKIVIQCIPFEPLTYLINIEIK